jgi:charged multivesicular body protein 7
LWWGLKKLGVVGDEGILAARDLSYGDMNKESAWHGEYVVMSLLEKAADGVAEMQQAISKGPADALYSYAGFRKTFASVLDRTTCVRGTPTLTENDTKVLLRFLERDCGVPIHEADEGVCGHFEPFYSPFIDSFR